MPISRDKFREIEARWEAAFEPPYYAGAEYRDYGMRVGLAVFKDDEKVFESADQLAAHLTDSQVLERFIQAAKEDIRRRLPGATP